MIASVLKILEKPYIQDSVILNSLVDTRKINEIEEFLRRQTAGTRFPRSNISNCSLGSCLFGVVTHREIATLVLALFLAFFSVFCDFCDFSQNSQFSQKSLLRLSITCGLLNSKVNRQMRFSLPSIKCFAAPPSFRLC